MQITLTNDHTDRVILRSFTLRKKKNALPGPFIDKDTGEEVEPHLLTPTQKGLVFEYLERSDGYVTIYMPYMILTSTLAKHLSKYKSFRCSGKILPTYKKRVKALKDIRSCLQEFRLSYRETRIFFDYIRSLGGELINASTPVENILELIDRFRESAKEQLNLAKVIPKSTLKVDSEESLKEVTSAIESLDESRSNLRKDYFELLKLTEQALELEKRPMDEKVKIESPLSSLKQEIGALNAVDIPEMYRKAVDAFRAATGQEADVNQLVSLSDELERLKLAFPSMSHVHADGRDLVIEIPGSITIIFSENKVNITGDVASLKAFTNTELVRSGKGSRFSSLLLDD